MVKLQASRNRSAQKRLAFAAVYGALLLAITSQTMSGADWRCNVQPVESCFNHHGRLSSQNGITLTIWLIGTSRIVNVDKTEVPSFLDKYLDLTLPNHSYVYGDFTVCPLAEDRPGHMRPVCVTDAQKLVVQNLADSRKTFRLLSTWPRDQR